MIPMGLNSQETLHYCLGDFNNMSQSHGSNLLNSKIWPTTCKSSNQASKWEGKEMHKNVTCFLRLKCYPKRFRNYWHLHALPYLLLTENGSKKRKYDKQDDSKDERPRTAQKTTYFIKTFLCGLPYNNV